MSSGTYSKIDSHSSARNNERLIQLLALVDKQALQAARSNHYSDIYNYIQTLEQAYINVKDGVVNDTVRENIEKVREQIYNRLDKMHSNARERGMKSLYFLMRAARQYNSLIITGLQSGQFFFRTGKMTTKGLNTKFFQDNIFSTKQNGDTNEETNEGTDTDDVPTNTA